MKPKKPAKNIQSGLGELVLLPEVPNRRADRNKRAELEKSTKLLAYLLSKLINEQGGTFRLLHEKLQVTLPKNDLLCHLNWGA